MTGPAEPEIPFRVVNEELGVPPVDVPRLAAHLATVREMRALRVLSLGAGVQSTTVSLMASIGEIEPFDAVIFSDTGWEPKAVYTHLRKLAEALDTAGIPMLTVSAGNIRDDHADPQSPHLFIRKPRKHPEYLGKQRTFIPVFIKAPEGGYLYRGDEEETETAPVGATPGAISKERPGKTRRTCTKTYKIEPVEKMIRILLGLKPRQRWPLEHTIEQSFGISWDESSRMSDPTRPSFSHHYPLVDRRMTRTDCEQWNIAHGWDDVPRSACVGCPFRRNDEWRTLRDESPDEFADAIDFDERFRARQAAGLLPMEGTPYLHDSRVPLAEADIEEHPNPQMSLFESTCEGFCGT